jgi:hypothetical protein
MSAGQALAQPANAPPTSGTDNLFQTYYRNPTPDAALRVVNGFDQTFASQKPDPTTESAVIALSGWLAVVFERQPDQTRAIVESVRTGQSAMAVAMALEMSGDAARSKKILGQLQAPPQIVEAVGRLPNTLPAAPLQEPADVDRHWGAAFASGDPAYVRPIVDAMLEPVGRDGVTAGKVANVATLDQERIKTATSGLNDRGRRALLLAGDAAWTLRVNNRSHAFVSTAIAEAACRYHDPERLELVRALLAGAQPGVVPPCARDALQASAANGARRG